MPLSKARDRERKRSARLEKDKFQPNIPLYNLTRHRIGDTVKIQRGKHEVTVTIPELDADGQPIYDD